MKKYVFTLLGILAISFSGFYLYQRHLITQAMFNVEALGRYIRAHQLVTGKKILSLSELPDVRLASSAHGFEFVSSRLRERIWRGYIYDLAHLDEDRFIILASPVSPNIFLKEFAILDDLNLRVDFNDDASDSYEQIRQWPILPAGYDLVTKIH